MSAALRLPSAASGPPPALHLRRGPADYRPGGFERTHVREEIIFIEETEIERTVAAWAARSGAARGRGR